MTLTEIIRDILAFFGLIAIILQAYRLWHWNKKRITLKQLEARSKEYRRVQGEPPRIDDDDGYGTGAAG